MAMTIKEALQKLREFEEAGERVDRLVVRYGNIFIDLRMVQRGVRPCPYCGGMMGMGVIEVRHQDGRSVQFSPELYHYVDAGHPLPKDVVKRLVEIVADA